MKKHERFTREAYFQGKRELLEGLAVEKPEKGRIVEQENMTRDKQNETP